jgi:hypothetical protein
MAGMFHVFRNHGSLETQIFIPKTKAKTGVKHVLCSCLQEKSTILDRLVHLT